ncbi:MAG: methyltransferase family protein [Candidatus Thorarchaeota archaeon]
MIEWINLLFLTTATILSLFFYIKSVQPATLAKKIRDDAYKICERYREYASISFFLFFIGYLLLYFFPLPLPTPVNLPWDYIITLMASVLIAIPSFWLMYKGVKDAGEETLRPKKEHEMYGGLYEKVRHPQSLGEVWVGHIISLVLNSTFLFLFSFLWIPIFYYMTVVEERDLLIRYGQLYIEYRERVGMYFPKRTKSKHESEL